MNSSVANQHPASRNIVSWLERATLGCLFLFAASAPHSIAITQASWLLGMLFWVTRFAFYPRPKLFRSPVDYPLFGFFVLTGLSAFLSYEPMVSIGKLRAASLFTIVYLFAQNIPSRRVIRLLALTLVSSAAVGVLYVAGERIVGRGVKLNGVAENSPLAAARWAGEKPSRFSKKEPELFPIRSGDTVLEIDGYRVRELDDLVNALSGGPDPANVKIFRAEWIATLIVPRGGLLPGATAEQQLGVSGWSRGRDWRASGLFGLYVSYAEAVQLILALAIGMFLSLRRKRSRAGFFLMSAVVALIFALGMTFTRASWLAFLVSTSVILVLSASRRTILVASLVAIPLVLAGLFFLQRNRNVGFLDRSDLSTSWRVTVWQEGFELLASKPRHLMIGVGMDSIKKHWRDWNLFDRGRLPWGHLHSNPLQIAVERGVPALIVWLIFLGAYARMLWRLARDQVLDNWIERGVVLGALGGLCGFFVSGLVHYNWGDSEVIEIFYCIIGLTLAIEHHVRQTDQ